MEDKKADFMILLDGKKLAEKIISELKNEVSKKSQKFRLAIIKIGSDAATESFLKIKIKTGEKIGIGVKVFSYARDIAADKLTEEVGRIVHESKNTGVIIQLPVPKHLNSQHILDAVTAGKDADVLSSSAIGNFATGRSPIFPPVAGAIKVFFEEYNIDYKSKRILIIGAGRLVGRPAASWLLAEDVGFSIVTENSPDFMDLCARADIIISGAGRAGLIKGDMVKNGVIVVDAGSSESKGKIKGDVDFESVSKKASYITPVPGGVGPLSVAMLFYNLVKLADRA